MGSKDYVIVYDERYAVWLAEQGYPYPSIKPGNRLPTTREFKRVLNKLVDYSKNDTLMWGHRHGSDAYSLVIENVDWTNDEAIPFDDYFTIRGDFDVELALVIALCSWCGQLLIFPDTGDPAVVVDANDDPQAVYAVWQEGVNQDDSWQYVCKKLYASGQ